MWRHFPQPGRFWGPLLSVQDLDFLSRPYPIPGAAGCRGAISKEGRSEERREEGTGSQSRLPTRAVASPRRAPTHPPPAARGLPGLEVHPSRKLRGAGPGERARRAAGPRAPAPPAAPLPSAPASPPARRQGWRAPRPPGRGRGGGTPEAPTCEPPAAPAARPAAPLERRRRAGARARSGSRCPAGTETPAWAGPGRSRHRYRRRVSASRRCPGSPALAPRLARPPTPGAPASVPTERSSRPDGDAPVAWGPFRAGLRRRGWGCPEDPDLRRQKLCAGPSQAETDQNISNSYLSELGGGALLSCFPNFGLSRG